jgi:tRNA modification GTPase
MRLVDTAGLRHTSDAVEKMGIEVSHRYLRRAHVVLACGDTKSSIEKTAGVLSDMTDAAVIRVRTKIDIVENIDSSDSDIEVSADEGTGLAALATLMDSTLSRTVGSVVAEAPILTRTRHVQAITRSREELLEFELSWAQENVPAPVAAVHLTTATTALESLIGAVSTDDVLDRVFSSFCVGK